MAKRKQVYKENYVKGTMIDVATIRDMIDIEGAELEAKSSAKYSDGSEEFTVTIRLTDKQCAEFAEKRKVQS